ncbi:MAG TPA: sigma-54 dependent transcriptional regulator [Alphaproteobacteria bacterium]|nr:sigma-54 dependent transcriptional regulator [Alphaproteobacteria bacterium]
MSHDILIVDDEADIRMLMSGVLRDEGYETRDAADSDSALAAIQARRPSLVILDIWLHNSRLDGLEILDQIRKDHLDLPVVMISGHGNIETAVTAIKKGAYEYIEKPFKADRLLLVVERAIEASRLRRENAELKMRAGGELGLVGDSQLANQLRATIDKVAPTNSRVLIGGPPGVGKEVVARLIHSRSGRSAGPFVPVNCAAMTPEHIEMALFGVEAGVEGPGSPRKTGTFENAHGGTLFLDEVADMPLVTQGKIVRVLQEQTFERVGGHTKVAVDVRVIASTNRDLQELITAGRFREDLYYRLNVVPVRVPPLKERREDIPLLVRHFMQMAARSSGLPEREIGDDAMTALQAHSWPGNVRQLRNAVEWMLIMAPGDAGGKIRADMLPPEILDISPAVLRWDKSGEMMALPLREAREVFEREYLAAQILRFGGNITRTASFVGMERSALHRKLKSLGLTNGDAPTT